MSAALSISAGTSLRDALQQSALPPLEARILLAYALQLTRVQLITQDTRLLTSTEATQLDQLFARRLSGEPIAYLVGEREFFGLSLKVTPDVLIPRPETELLVELAMAHLPDQGSALDMGTGSGAIAVALAHQRADAQVTALDASVAALAIARENATRHGVAVRFLQSDWYAGLQEERFSLIASNPPYIHANDAHLQQGDLRFEPAMALTDHGDGLGALRRIIAGAPHHLDTGGWLLLEHGYDQAETVRQLLTQQGFAEVQSWQDLAGIARVSGGRLPGMA